MVKDQQSISKQLIDRELGRIEKELGLNRVDARDLQKASDERQRQKVADNRI